MSNMKAMDIEGKSRVKPRITSMQIAALFLPYTPRGCEFAKYILQCHKRTYSRGITGWEIVYMARKTLVEVYSNE